TPERFRFRDDSWAVTFGCSSFLSLCCESRLREDNRQCRVSHPLTVTTLSFMSRQKSELMTRAYVNSVPLGRGFSLLFFVLHDTTFYAHHRGFHAPTNHFPYPHEFRRNRAQGIRLLDGLARGR